jgi:hypothetical protein
MARHLFYIKLTPIEHKELEEFLKIKHLPLTPRQKRERARAQAVWFSALRKWHVKGITKYLRIGERSVWRWIKNYQQQGLKGLLDK